MGGVGTSVDEIREAAKLLGLAERFDEKDARQAYSTYVRRWHPDVAAKQGVGEQEANDRMAAGNKAYAVVKDALSKNGGAYTLYSPSTRSTRGTGTQSNQSETNGATERPKETTYWDAQEQRWKTDPTGQRTGWYDGGQEPRKQRERRTRRQTVNQNDGRTHAAQEEPSPSTASQTTDDIPSSTSHTSSSSSSIFEDMSESAMEPVSDVLFANESFPVKVLHVFLTLIQIATVARVVIRGLGGMVPSQCSSLDEMIGYLFTHLWSVATGLIGCLLGGVIAIWLTRLVARFIMRRANDHVIIAVILDALLIWWTAESLLPIMPAEFTSRIQDAIATIATNFGM